MIDFTIEIEIARPPEQVFAYVTDPAKLPTWQTNTISAVPDGPLRLGSMIREGHRGPRGRELASLVEVSELEPKWAAAISAAAHARRPEAPVPRALRDAQARARAA